MHRHAEKLIRQALDQQWDEQLVEYYGSLRSNNVGALLRRVEQWLRDRPEEVGLLLAAGRLCVRNELWGKARSYLETCIGLRPTPEAYNELGRLMLRLDDQEAASEAFRKGLELSYGANAHRLPAAVGV